ncbi:MAG TPA: CotH kinase family protein [Ignavibacteriaceae bacterium]|nr:CotH kinase family protein [Ignavibacteriaceae bacterium]
MYLFTRFFSLFLFFSILFFHFTFAQEDDSWKLYDDSQVARVDITIDPAVLEWLYQNVQSDSEFVASFHYQNAFINETVDSIGFRLRGNTSRDAAKKSFKVSFNTFLPGREFYGVDKLNLNGEHNDPSIIRSKLCFDHYQTIGMTASRANHAEVYINGQYYGLYISVEHIDDEFLNKNFGDDTGNLWKCLYPADLNYLGNDPNTYINLNNNGRPSYELKTNETENDFSELVHFISILNNTPSSLLADSLESVIVVPDVLKYFAMNILVGGWDDYWSLMNNYYLYHEPTKDIFHLIPYDYDNTFGIDWSGNNWTTANPYNYPKVVSGYRPLAERLIQNAQYRNLYTHFLEFYSTNVYLLSRWVNRLDSLKLMITNSAILDTFRTKDYGFTIDDFNNSYSSSGYSNQHVKFGLKQFINLRNASLPAQLSYQNAKPIVYSIDYEPINPGANDSIYVYTSVFDNDGLSEVSIYYQEDGSANTEIYPMVFDPISNTKIVEEADRWIGVIPPLGAGVTGKFSIYAKDLQNQSQFYPRKKGIEIKTQQIITNGIVVNEFMADNVTTIADPNGEFDDWIELYNPTANPITLTGKYLTDKKTNLTKWQFTEPNLVLNPNQFLLIWCDEDSGQAGLHTNFKLSASGEFIALVDADGVTVLDSLSFGPQTADISFGRFPDGTNNWSALFPTPGNANSLTTVDDDKIILSEFNISAYPNPFNPSTSIIYNIPNVISTAGRNLNINLIVYDILGNFITTLVNEEKPAGTYEVVWNGKNNFGMNVSSGIYFVRIKANQQSQNLKLVLLK